MRGRRRMACPRCAFEDAGTAECPRCGVVYAKLSAAPTERPLPAPGGRRAEPSPVGAWMGVAVGLAAILGGVAVVVRPSSPPAAAPPRAAAAGGTAIADAGTRPAFAPPEPSAARLAVEMGGERFGAEDRERAKALAARLPAAGPSEVKDAEDLYTRFPGDVEVRRLLGSVLLAAAQQARSERRGPQAAAWLQKATTVADDTRPWLVLAEVLADEGDWAAAERAARGALALDPRDAWAWRALGYALLRQDRGREAAEALQAALEVQDDASTRGLLEHVSKGLSDESGMTQRTLSHFNVRYDGEAHESVGREILRALERHYATLASTLDHQPAAPIPVVLFTGEAYYDATGAPAWSGGVYDTLDGRIRIPVGGLTASLTPDMDTTLVHELTHAFVADRTRGIAPRDLHEGLAQYMEGKRSQASLGPHELQALADGRLTGVGGYYAGALSFVEYLIANRGLGGMNDLLRGMAETGSVDEAFRGVHGGGHEETRRQWRERLRQQYGS